MITRQDITVIKNNIHLFQNMDCSCTNCDHMGIDHEVAGGSVCIKFDRQKIPDDFKAKGCDQWIFGDIPF